jgi:hypothetical protein
MSARWTNSERPGDCNIRHGFSLRPLLNEHSIYDVVGNTVTLNFAAA